MPITNISLSLSYAKQKQFRENNVEEPEDGLVELFVMFSYDPTRRIELQPTLDMSHKVALCPVVRNFSPCGCQGFLRYAAMKRHICPNLTQHTLTESAIFDSSRNPTFRQITFSRETITERMKTRKEILDILLPLIGGTAISYSVAGSADFHRFCRTLIELARTHPTLTPTELYPAMTSMFLSYSTHQKAREIMRNVLTPLRNTAISIMIDAATIAHKHLLAISFIRLSVDAQPQFLQVCAGPSTIAEYYTTLAQLSIELQRKYGIEIATICTDGLTAQIASIKQLNLQLAKLSSSSSTQSPKILPIHIPCLNHRVNLVTQHFLLQDPSMSPIKDTLRLFSVEANKKQFHEIFGKPCPTLLEWRWLSAHMVASFVRLHRNIISQHKILSDKDIISILKCELLLTPLMELQLFFESSKMKLCFVFPAILRCIHEYQILVKDPYFSSPESFASVVGILAKLFNELLSGTLGKLSFLAYTMTPVGKLMLLQNRILSCYSPKLSLNDVMQRLFQCSFLLIFFLPSIM